MDGVSVNFSSTTERITLQIGERTYHTTRATITENPVLANLTSLGSPDGDEAGPDPSAGSGPYFLDADPDAFDHVLRYLRTGAYPLFHDPIGGVGGGDGGSSALRAGGDSHTFRTGKETLRVVRVKQDGYETAHQCPRVRWRHTGYNQDCIWDGCLSQRNALASRDVKLKVLTIEYGATVVEIHEDAVMTGGGGGIGGDIAATLRLIMLRDWQSRVQWLSAIY